MKNITTPSAVIINHDLEKILYNQYQLQITGITPVKDVWCLETTKGTYCLKELLYRKEKVKFMISALDHLVKKDFSLMAQPVYNQKNQLYTQVHQHIFILTEWVAGHQCNFGQPTDLGTAAITLAKFHQQAQGYVSPPGSRAQWREWPHTFLNRKNSLFKYKEQAQARAIKTNFDQLFLTHFDYYSQQAKLALNLINQGQYQQLMDQAQQNRCFTHQDVAGRNFIIAPTNTAYLIDFDMCRYDLRVIDLLRLIERTMKKCNWDFRMAELALNKYQTISPISKAEFNVLFAFLVFPQKYWRNAKRYYHHKRQLTEEKLTHKLNKIIAMRHQRHQFLQTFAWHYCQRLLD